jgi:hypothetical protein
LSPRDHTAAFSSEGDGRSRTTTRTGEAVPWRSDDSHIVTIIDADEYHIVSGGSFAIRMLLDAKLWSGFGSATSSRPPLIVRHGFDRAVTTAPTRAPRTAIQEAIAEIRALSRLTNEEIAPLAGVSRRSVQAWVAGAPISARKDHRVRALCEAIRALAAPDPQMTRHRLFERLPGNVRAYDLLAEELFNEAVDLALGRRTTTALPVASQAQDLPAQLDHHEGYVDIPPERLNRRFSKRLRR